MPELDACQRAEFVDSVGHQGLGRDIVLVPQGAERIRRIIGAGMDRAVFGVDHAPAAFGLDAAHRRHRIGQAITHAGAMGHLIEPVGRCHRADFDRLEQDVVAGITRHGTAPANRTEER